MDFVYLILRFLILLVVPVVALFFFFRTLLRSAQKNPKSIGFNVTIALVLIVFFAYTASPLLEGFDFFLMNESREGF